MDADPYSPIAEPLPDRPARIGADAPTFETMGEEEISPEILGKRICDFDLKIEGRPLEKVIERFRTELVKRGITKLHPAFYLTDEWGVPEGTVAIGVPFYLADAMLLKVHKKKRAGLVEGESDEDVLRYLRHEMGHVVNYAYRLYTSEEWTRLFGSMSRPYTEDYHVLPFSLDFVRHLPGGYAQKHPDEDWAETFAVWLTPGLDWRERYADSPGALAKLLYCERVMESLRDAQPEVTSAQIDYDTRAIKSTVQEFYESIDLGEAKIPRSLDGDLQIIFARRHLDPLNTSPRLGDGSLLLKRNCDYLANSVYRWTGVDPTLVSPIVNHLAGRAAAFKMQYPLNERDEILVDLSGFLTALAMNYQYKGKFVAG
ncbi:MAG: putative zinc-binding metallopeptidase [Planctomycetes bacterium]|nr:putative zinc-binding metallopeptidase [Planctomycetota bacterium]